MYFVYELLDQEIPFYVGLTTDPERRIYDHVYAPYKTKKKGDYLQNMFSLGRKPTLRILEEVEGKEIGRRREKYWIQTYTEQGIALVNSVHVNKKKMKDMKSLKPLFNKWLKFPVLDAMWTLYQKEKQADTFLPEEMLILVNQFVEEIPTQRELREKEKRHLEIWESCLVWKLTHPDVGPAFSG